MKKTVFTLLGVFVLALCGASLAVAQEAAPAEKVAPAVKAETISGTISMVVAEKKLVVLTGSGGISYNFKVTGGTRIKVAGTKAKFAELAAQTNKSATVKFLPLRSGNVAQSIEVSQ